MINLHPDFYNMTFKLNPNRKAENRPAGALKPIGAYLDGGNVFVVCACVDSGAVSDILTHWLIVVPPDAA